MVDISRQLTQIMQINHCSSMPAFLLLMEDDYEFHINQSKSEEQSDRGLCDKGNQYCRGQILG